MFQQLGFGLPQCRLIGQLEEVTDNLTAFPVQAPKGQANLRQPLENLPNFLGQDEARELLLQKAPTEVGDKVWRAFGLLKHARSLTFEETMNLLSGVRLGAGLNLIPDVRVYTLNKLLIFTQPAHLGSLEGRPTGDPELATIRATYVRRLLAAEAS